MSIKKIIREELDDLDWMRDVPNEHTLYVGMTFRIDNKSEWKGYVPFKGGGHMIITILGIDGDTVSIRSESFRGEDKTKTTIDEKNYYEQILKYVKSGYYQTI